MKIGIIDHCWEYNIDTPYNEPLGGTQSAICYFLEEMAKQNHDVYLFNNIKKNIEIRNVKHISYSNIILYLTENKIHFDIIILIIFIHYFVYGQVMILIKKHHYY